MMVIFTTFVENLVTKEQNLVVQKCAHCVLYR